MGRRMKPPPVTAGAGGAVTYNGAPDKAPCYELGEAERSQNVSRSRAEPSPKAGCRLQERSPDRPEACLPVLAQPVRPFMGWTAVTCIANPAPRARPVTLAPDRGHHQPACALQGASAPEERPACAQQGHGVLRMGMPRRDAQQLVGGRACLPVLAQPVRPFMGWTAFTWNANPVQRTRPGAPRGRTPFSTTDRRASR
jgi:hypothetical protein